MSYSKDAKDPYISFVSDLKMLKKDIFTIFTNKMHIFTEYRL